MRLQDQCCTLEQAKRLKELGVLQSSYASWFGDEKHIILDSDHQEDSRMRVTKYVFITTTEPFNSLDEERRSLTCNTKPIAAAFNVAELGVMLCLGSNYIRQIPTYDPRVTEFEVNFKRNINQYHFERHKSEAVARASALIACLEEKLISIDDLNNQLSKL